VLARYRRIRDLAINLPYLRAGWQVIHDKSFKADSFQDLDGIQLEAPGRDGQGRLDGHEERQKKKEEEEEKAAKGIGGRGSFSHGTI